ncbi:hypothetical protein ACR71G_21635 [Xenorhabdus bovienii]|uniref:hypothetical protein n=1 Tax=Xenorhabdus bovienii TaxID=40576 RepID=UPI003DA5C899
MYNSYKLSEINFLNDKHYALYQVGKPRQTWDCELNWKLVANDLIPERLRDTAVTVASLSDNVEILGMENAAGLLLQSNDFFLKIGLAQAVNDEARHSELFAKYAILANGKIKDLSRTRDIYLEHFAELKTFEDIDVFIIARIGEKSVYFFSFMLISHIDINQNSKLVRCQ